MKFIVTLSIIGLFWAIATANETPETKIIKRNALKDSDENKAQKPEDSEPTKILSFEYSLPKTITESIVDSAEFRASPDNDPFFNPEKKIPKVESVEQALSVLGFSTASGEVIR